MQNSELKGWMIGHLLLWLWFWGIGAIGQIAISWYIKHNPNEEMANNVLERINVKWYFRPVFGLPPTTGKVILRVGIAQIIAIVFAGIELLIASRLNTDQIQSLSLVLLFGYFIIMGVVGAILNAKKPDNSAS